MSKTLTITEPHVDALAHKLDAMDLTFEEQAILVAMVDASKRLEVFAGSAPVGNESRATSKDVELPAPGAGLRSAFAAKAADDEIRGYGGGICIEIH